MKMKILLSLVLCAAYAMLATAPAHANALAGTAWRMIEYNNGNEAIATAIAETEISLHFNEDGSLYGTAGCNDYRTAYTVTGDKISIQPAAATRKFCAEPEGVMAQETAFLNALESAARWRVRGEQLDILYSDGTLAIRLASIKKSNEKLGNVMIFKRGPKEVVVEMRGSDELDMTIDGKTWHMRQATSASGARYVAVDDNGTEFWNKGDMAHITVKNKELGEFKLVGDMPGDDELYITINGETFRMKHVPSASGSKYEATDDPTTVFWSKGRNATLTVRGREYSKYVLIRNSPNEDELFLSVDGENFRLRRVPSASGAKYEATSDPSTIFWSKGDEAKLIVRGKDYIAYNASDDKTVAPLAPKGTWTDVEWYVRSIGGQPVVPNSTVTIVFDTDGTLAGKASVNSYSSSWIAVGDDRLLIDMSASTMMAGPQALMDQETRFLRALEDVRRVAVVDGTLVLTMKDGREIVATQ